MWEGNCLNPVLPETQAEALAEIRVPSILGAVFGEIYDPQGVLIQPNVSDTSIRSKVNDHLGHHTFFVRMKQGQMEWWQPVNVQITKSEKSPGHSSFLTGEYVRVPGDEYGFFVQRECD